MSWKNDIASVVGQLERVNRSTEESFLAVTGKLTGLLAALRRVSSEARAIAGVISEESLTISQALQSVIESAGGMERQAHAAAGLTAVRSPLDRIRYSIAGFESVGTFILVAAALARIETARLGSGGVDLSHLAENFQASGESIGTRLRHVAEHAAGIESRIHSALADATVFDRRCMQALVPLIAAAGEARQEFQARREQSASAASQLAEESGLLAAAIGDIVAGLQFHDITRQQVEHAIAALVPLGGCGVDLPGAWPRGAASTLQLQIAQLSHSAEQFGHATGQIEERLATIAGNARSMAARSGGLLGLSENGGQSFYGKMENSCRAIAYAVEGSQALAADMRRALADFEQGLGSLQESVSEARSAEESLRWLALNARIGALRIGAAGDPLGAVAGGMLRLLGELEAASCDRADAIASIGALLDAVRRESNTADPEVEHALLAELRLKIENGHSSNQRTAGRIAEIGSLAAGLSRDVEEMRQGLAAAQTFQSTVADCCAILRRMHAEAPAEDTLLGQDALAELAGRYTMRAERDVHAVVVHAREPAVAPSENPGSSGGLGENVEFF